ncbi:hypothetical protein [Streptomyces sp. NPDC003379]
MPAAWREEYGLRRYGFHGLSYAWALDRAAELLGRGPERLQVVIAHLGGGCSACAVRDGRSVPQWNVTARPLEFAMRIGGALGGGGWMAGWLGVQPCQLWGAW